jgi:hypothetical protein
VKAFILAVTFCCSLAGADFSAAEAQTNLEKRAELYLKAAGEAMAEAKAAWRDGKTEVETEALKQVRQGIELAMKSLKDSGKDARRSPKYFKSAEISVRKMIRDLDNFRVAKGVDEREAIEQLLAYAHQAQEQLLLDIMTKKK